MKRISLKLWILFAAVWVVALAVVTLFECNLLPSGALIGDARAVYVAEASGVLFMMVGVPASLRLHHWAMQKKGASPQNVWRWGVFRLAILAAVVWANLVIYYLTLDTLGALAALIALIATLFCLPSPSNHAHSDAE